MNFISDIFKKKTTSALGIDIGSSSIKVVQLQKKGNKAVLETYGELSLGPYGGVSVGQSTNLTTDKIAQAVNDLLNEKELASMVPIEARKYIPVPISDVTIDWSIIPKSEVLESVSQEKNKGKIKTLDILLVAIHNNIINQYKEIVSKTQLDAKFFEIEIFSSMRAILEGVQWPVMIFDMGASTTKLYTVDRGVIEHSHTINKGSQDITLNIARILNIPVEEAEVLKRSVGMGKTADGVDLSETVSVVADSIFTEANRFLFDFQKKKNQNMKSIFLTGGGSALRGFRDLAAKNFQLSFIPKNPVTERVFQKKKTGMVGLLVVSLFVISIIVSIGLFIYSGIVKSDIQSLGSQIVEAEKNADKESINQMSQFSDKLSAVKIIVNKHRVISNFLNAFASSTVSTVQFTSLNYGNLTGRGLAVNLKGKATGYSSIALQEDVFSHNKNFKSMTFSNLTLAEGGMVSFDLEILVDPQIATYSP